MKGYVPRRLRRETIRGPRYVLKVDHPIDREQADLIKKQWLAAGRAGVAVVSPGIEITWLGGRR